MKFVVTGGAGFVGNNLVKLLVKNGHQVTVIDNLHKGKKENLDKVIDKIEFLNLDIQDYDSMEENMQDVDGVFHQAALTVVQDSFKIPEEYHNVNVKGTENIFKIAQKNNFKVVYASSSSVYGHQENVPILENYEKKPINPYGQTKLDEVFLTGTAAEITPVIKIETKKIGEGRVGDVTKQVMDTYTQIVMNNNKKFSKWLTNVY